VSQLATTKINVSTILGLDGQISQARSKITNVKGSLQSVHQHVDSRILGRHNLHNRFQTAYAHLASVEARVNRIKTVAETGARAYRNIDETLLKKAEQLSGRPSSQKNKKYFV